MFFSFSGLEIPSSSTSLKRSLSFYDPSKKSRNVATVEKTLSERYRVLMERMTSTRSLSPAPGAEADAGAGARGDAVTVAHARGTPPRRRIRPVSAVALFSAWESPSPQKHGGARLTRSQEARKSEEKVGVSTLIDEKR